MKKILIGLAAILASGASPAAAQSPANIALRLEPGSEIVIDGTSTVKSFTCQTKAIEAIVVVDRNYTTDLTKVTRPIVSVEVSIPVKSLSCGNKTMDGHMYKALKADVNPTIRYTLSGYDLAAATASGFTAKTAGILNIAGRNKKFAMTINAARTEGAKATANGEQSILMTDFGMKPPSLMLGTMKVGDKIHIKFNLKVGPAMIAQLNAVYAGETP